jgi:hypothetical protein
VLCRAYQGGGKRERLAAAVAEAERGLEEEAAASFAVAHAYCRGRKRACQVAIARMRAARGNAKQRQTTLPVSRRNREVPSLLAAAMRAGACIAIAPRHACIL